MIFKHIGIGIVISIILISIFYPLSIKERYCESRFPGAPGCGDEEILNTLEKHESEINGVKVVTFGLDYSGSEQFFELIRAVDPVWIRTLNGINYVDRHYTYTDLFDTGWSAAAGRWNPLNDEIYLYRHGDYPTFSIYLNQTLCHEIGHHVLGITSGLRTKHTLVEYLGPTGFCFEGLKR